MRILAFWLTLAFIALQTCIAVELPEEGIKLGSTIVWHQATLETDQIDIILKLSEELWQAPPDQDMTLGFVDATLWAKVPITVKQPSNWILKTNIATLNKLESWIVDEDQFIYPVSGSTGIDIATSPYRTYRLPDLTQDVRFPAAGDYLLLFRIEQNGFFDFPAELLPTDTVLDREVQGSFSLGLYNGLFITVLIISLVYFAISFDFSFLAFSCAILGFTLLFGYIDGILAWRLWPNFPSFNTLAKIFSLPLLNIGIAWYAITFFKLPEKLNWLRKFLFLLLFLAIALFIIAPMLSFQALIYSGLFLALITIATSLMKGLILAIQYKNTIAIPFSLAWAVFGGYVAIILMSIFNLVPLTTNNLVLQLKFYFSLMVVLLFAALAMRKRKIETEIIRATEESKAKSNLMARVSHEIRTPINGILGLSQLLEDHVKDEEAKQYQQLIVESTESLLHIVDDLMDARQIEEGKVQLVLSQVDLAKVIHSCTRLLRAQIEDKGLTLEVKIATSQAPIAMLDETRTRQIITNLLNNAYKFTEQGSIRVELEYLSAEQQFCIRIIDTGIGIEEAQLENILLPFEQAANSREKVHQGIGLGLFISKNLIDMMAGKLHITSTLDKGSIFEVRLPENLTLDD